MEGPRDSCGAEATDSIKGWSGYSITPDQAGYLPGYFMPAPQFRAAVITDHRAQAYTELPDGVQYIAWSLEHAPTTGKAHNQAYAYGNKMTVSKWSKLFGNAHVEGMKGTFAQNDAYCSKESALSTLGEKPMGTGHRRDLQQIQSVMDKLPPGVNVMDAAMDADNFNVCIQYKKGLEAYVANKRRRYVQSNRDAPDVIFITGPAGSGKTRYVWDKEPNVYVVPSLQWKDGYDLDEAVLYDNLEPQAITDRSHFLKEIDRYPLQVPVKGGFTTWKPKRVYITSTYSSESFAAKFAEANEWYRRVTHTIVLPVSI